MIDKGADGPRGHISQHEQKPHDIGCGGHHHEDQDQAHQGMKGVAPKELNLLKADVLDVAHHEKRQDIDYYQDEHRACRREFAQFSVKRHYGGHHHGGCRDGQSDKVAGVNGARLHIKAGQPEGPANHEEKGRGPTELLEILQGPEIDQDGRGHPRSHEIGQGIVLHPETGGALGQAGDAAVQTIQDHRNQNGPGRGVEPAVHGGHNGVEPGEQAPGGDQVGQQVNAPKAAPVFLFTFPAETHATSR